MKAALPATIVLGVALGSGLCLAGEEATVRIRHVLEPSRGIPEGIKALAILDAGVSHENDALRTETDWSILAANCVQHLLQQAVAAYGVELQIVDRRHTAAVLKEHDLAAAGLIPDQTAGAAARLLEVQGLILAEIHVRIGQRRESRPAIDLGGLLDELGRDKRKPRGGRGKAPRSAEVLKEHVTVQTVFHLFDAKTSRNWVTYAKLHRYADKPGLKDFIGGLLPGEDDDPRDQIIEQAVQRGAREFVGMLVPLEVEYEVTVKSSGHDACEEGVRALRAAMYDQAITQFKQALADDAEDDRAAYAAGVAAEAAGRYEPALGFYRQACRIDDDARYLEAARRLEEIRERIRK